MSFIAGLLLLLIAVVAHVAAHGGARIAMARVLGVPGARFPLGVEPSYARASRGKRMGVAIAGTLGNYAVAVALFFCAMAFFGTAREDLDSMRVMVMSGAPAAEAGIRDGDRIVSVNGEEVRDWPALRAAVQRGAGGSIRVRVEREGAPLDLDVRPASNGKIGVAPSSVIARAGVGESFVGAWRAPIDVLYNSARSWIRMSSGAEKAEVAGPVAIVRETGKQTDTGAGPAFFFVAALSSYFWPFSFLYALLCGIIPRRPKE
jgi:regulator of sigma E protease